ncbi:N-acetylphosphinothricin deacetylase [Streptomyces viridochromogenes DSM 40736]|uniref:N-acetylphosphinothricin deacetylase n=2 Tax=Streptomyces viridochromogenes TaxID=1938 RepID=D9XF31_STRVT|nr:alpha/beta hydrolase [Streptomyces viridochromogenes]AAU00089.1 N-acetylphosphinothricin deacetylase; Dea [Streptomyces viridochromogenes]EFL30510.1 N-acetylphosphinothricin deacetylase [Streptomyces viridochromogenes DSM 40736]
MASSELELVRELIGLNWHTRNGDVEPRRVAYDRAQEAFGDLGLPPGETVVIGDCSAEWVRPAQEDGRTLLYLHGGSYALGSPQSHRHLSSALGAAAGAAVLALHYRRPPESPFPAAVEDAVAAYRMLRERGCPPGRITFAGDSAGAGLAVAALQVLRDAGDPLPAAAVCISPWADLACEGASHVTRKEREILLDTEDLLRMAGRYLAGTDPRNPLASPAHGDLTGLPPLLIQVGSEEVLYDDARALEQAALKAGVPVTFDEWPEMFHVWHWYHPVLPEGRAAVETAGVFLRRATEEGER